MHAPPPPPRDRERKPKKEPTAAKAAEQLFKKVTLKISEAEGLEQAMRKGGMRLGFEIYRSPTIAATPFRFTNTPYNYRLIREGRRVITPAPRNCNAVFSEYTEEPSHA